MWFLSEKHRIEEKLIEAELNGDYEKAEKLREKLSTLESNMEKSGWSENHSGEEHLDYD